MQGGNPTGLRKLDLNQCNTASLTHTVSATKTDNYNNLNYSHEQPSQTIIKDNSHNISTYSRHHGSPQSDRSGYPLSVTQMSVTEFQRDKVPMLL